MKNPILTAVALVVVVVVLGLAGVPSADAKSRPRVVRVTINSKGYTPSAVTVRKGQPVKLILTRSDANNCGGEIVFEKLGIRRELPVGKPVTVEFTPTEKGEIAFTCGMGMMRGRIVVN